MGAFRQLGDPVCPACLCEHHGAAYAEREATETPLAKNIVLDAIAIDAIITQVPITITETCCVVVNAALISYAIYFPTDFEIERPLGTIRTIQEDRVDSVDLTLFHHASWEVLDPGTYTYYLVNRRIGASAAVAAWIKAIASDCEG